MGQAAESPFSYLAFDFVGGGIIGHGYSAFHAAQDADRAEPSATIKIVYVGYIGALIWGARLSLPEVCEFVLRRPAPGELDSELFRRAIMANRRFADAELPVFFGT
jgi:hypothetical protein